MMRPERAFIMPRMTERDRRNTPRRLVAITSSNSSSFMRMVMLSRVMPALLTNIATAPTSSSICFMTSSVCTPSATLSSKPRHLVLMVCKSCSIACAPDAEVAVPTTIAPCCAKVCAIARPMPRDAPVTKATFPSNLPITIPSLIYTKVSLIVFKLA